MEVQDAERQYWDAMKKSMKTTQEQLGSQTNHINNVNNL